MSKDWISAGGAPPKSIPITYATGREGVFAGGDLQTGPWVAIGAVAAGKEAAESIVRYLDGVDMAEGREPIERGEPELPADSRRRSGRGTRQNAPTAAEASAGAISMKWNWVFDETAGRSEAHRCLNCGFCCECYQCVDACGAEAVTLATHAQEQRERLQSPSGVGDPGTGLYPVRSRANSIFTDMASSPT